MKNYFALSIVSCVQLQFDHIEEQNTLAETGFVVVLLLYQVVVVVEVVKLVVVVVEVVKLVVAVVEVVKLVVVVVEVVKIVVVAEIQIDLIVPVGLLELLLYFEHILAGLVH